MPTLTTPEATLDELYTMLDGATESAPATGAAHVDDFESFYWFTLRVPGHFHPGEFAPQ